METNRIKKLFDDLFDGHPWIEVMIWPALTQLTASQAASRIYPEWNTIWEITNHMISWRENVLQRIQGHVLQTPASNYIEPVTDTSDAAWNQTLSRFKDTQEAWTSFLANWNESEFEKTYPSNGMSYYEHVQGILQHDAYHLGQIVIMSKRVSK
jgi:uncharacterized damage-inducible protein DinB